MELRCGSRILHGVVFDATGIAEFTCRSKRCGKEPGVVVVHRFDLSTGRMTETKRFSNPKEANFPWQLMPVRLCLSDSEM